MRRKARDSQIVRHWKKVRALRCCITEKPYPTIHHCHGGSITEVLGYDWSPGEGQKQNDWLVIPLDAEYHVGNHGIDYGMGVLSWEKEYGTQIEHLIWVCEETGVDVFSAAGCATLEEIKHRVSSSKEGR